ncbi:MotE family protein [Siminovitchia sediminis]|uniref:MotE family protein n=1 Tax=Siminovitchia sediminis TaxID=1274353 RepID=A0ABW4KCG6_9BACI
MGKKVDKPKELKKSGVFQKFLTWIIIPLLLILFLAMLAATVTGVNVYEKAKEAGAKLPLISSMMGGSDMVSRDDYNEGVISLEAQIEEKNVEISRLERELEDSESKITLLEQDKKRLEAALDEADEARNEKDGGMKEVVDVYEAMMPKRAASIIVEMSDDEAVAILKQLNPESLARIMEKMPPDKAAVYTNRLASESQ